ncbi:MAG: peptidoglycan DD-metalloendopeptidase family protein [Polyangiaceae bacterium]
MESEASAHVGEEGATSPPLLTPVPEASSPETPEDSQVAPPPETLSPEAKAARTRGYAAWGVAVFLTIGAFVMMRGKTRAPETETTEVPLARVLPLVDAGASGVVSLGSFDGGFARKSDAPKTFRLRNMRETQEGTEVIEGTLGKRTFTAAMQKAGLSRADIARVVAAFSGQKSFDHGKPKDVFSVAFQRQGHKLVGFEYETNPTEVYQAVADADGKLVAKKLSLTVEHARVQAPVVIGDDPRDSLVKAGFEAELARKLDEALEGHVTMAEIRTGSRLRVIARETRVEGAFSRYEDVEAVEYIPARKGASPVRIYSLSNDSTTKHYDEKGQRPYHGAWSMPIPFARITSRFNPTRMHPVLHRVMPHNGVDFAGKTGTPVYAVASGTLKGAENTGPCGNTVQILHANGLMSVYCHLSRFAHLKVGDKVEGRQLVGFVGATGRVTGPHLHFAVKRGTVFIDPLSLKMGGVQTIPKGERDAFDTRKKELDLALDAIPLPQTGPDSAEGDGGADVDDDSLDDEEVAP